MNQRHRTRNTVTCTRIISLTVLGASASGAFAEVITVDDDGKADFASIQAAVDYASDGDEIVVAPGVYTSDHPAHVVDLLGKAITLRSSDGPEFTFIDGQGVRRGIACLNDETAETLIEGFTIQNGFGVDYDYDQSGSIEWWEESGGGMHAWYSSPTMNNCAFENNSSYAGGGLFIYESNSALTNCTFTINSASYGGGVCDIGEGSPTLGNCKFIGNSAAYGGGLHNQFSSPTLSDCTFSHNSTSYWGGGMYNNESTPGVTNCTFIGNSSEYGSGGGMYNKESSPTLTGCRFLGNWTNGSDTDSGGGGMCNESSRSVLTDCTFTSNAANQSSYTGGGGGMFNWNESISTLINCSFIDNTSGVSGGGMTNRSSTVKLIDCTFTLNSTTDTSYFHHGGALYNRESSVWLETCTINNNSTAGYGGGISNSASSSMVITNCTLFDNTNGALGPANGGGIFNSSTSTMTLADSVLCGNANDQIYGDWTDKDGNCLSLFCEDTDGDEQPDCGAVGIDTYLSVPDEYETIELAFDAAMDGALIEIASGTYSPVVTLDTLGKSITVRGAVDEQGTPTTVIDGRNTIRILQCLAGEGSDTVFENLVLKDGFAYKGGGMANMRSSPTINNCTFVGNSASGQGGGLSNRINSNPTLTNCTFVGNSTSFRGGGMYNWSNSNPTLIGCTLTGNTAEEGGGMYIWNNSSPTLIGCTLTGNTAEEGGGMYISESSPILADTIVCENTPDQIEGTWIDQGGNIVRDICISDCFFDFNGDGVVDGEELTYLLGTWGTDDPVADVNDDGIVDGNDLTIILAGWGACP